MKKDMNKQLIAGLLLSYKKAILYEVFIIIK